MLRIDPQGSGRAEQPSQQDREGGGGARAPEEGLPVSAKLLGEGSEVVHRAAVVRGGLVEGGHEVGQQTLLRTHLVEKRDARALLQAAVERQPVAHGLQRLLHQEAGGALGEERLNRVPPRALRTLQHL